jgi:ligand-binding sensor domain-containing protein
MKKFRSRLTSFLSLFLLLHYIPVFSQSYFFRNYSVEDGLPFINVSDIYQDSHGNLWTAGYGGLSKFDGVSFTNYSPKDGLLNNSVNTIVEDKKGNLWIGSISGINKIEGRKFTVPKELESFKGKNCICSLRDSKNNIWLGTEAGLIKITDNHFTFFSIENGLNTNHITTLFESKDSTLWIGTTNGINKLNLNENNKTTIQFEKAKSQLNALNISNINAFAEDETGNFWVGTNNGLYEISNNNTTCYTTKNQLPDNTINVLFLDFRKTLWIGTNKGLVKYVKNKFVPMLVQAISNSNYIKCMYQDFENNLWLGTYNGLYKYRGNPFVSYGANEGLFDNFIYGILRDSKKNLWVGTENGLFLSNKLTGGFFIKQSDFEDTQISQLYEYKANSLWIATESGLRIYENNKLQYKKDASGIFNSPAHCIYRDSKNNLWIGSDNKIFKYDGKTFQSFQLTNSSRLIQVWTFVEDKQGTLWIGTYLGGLFKLDLNKKEISTADFEECSQLFQNGSDAFLTSLIDSVGNLYFGTMQGLIMISNEKGKQTVTYFTTADGMSSDLVYSMTFGHTQNQLWLGTNQGLNLIDIEKYKKNHRKYVIVFGKQEGFVGVECNTNGTFVESDGSIWFGTVNGLIKYNPAQYIENTAEAKISIEGIKLFYKDTLLPNNTALPYNENNISFTYNGICLTNPEKVLYSHILEGFDKEWSPPTKERIAKYSNLSPGKYTFKVISSNNENVWNTDAAVFGFVIGKPYYKEWWFVFMVFTLLFALLLLSVRFRISAIKKRESEKTEMNKLIANIESQALRAQMNPHFIFNTLSSIQHYISSNETDAALKYLSRFAKLMRKIMDNTKQPMIAVSEELEALNLYLELEKMRFEKKFDYSFKIDETIYTNYDKIPSMLIQPYIENAIIHGLLPMQGNGKLTIELKKIKQTILCVIEDNGIGRKQSGEFKRNRVQQHKSMGMSITKERLELLNASLNSNISVEVIDLYENGIAAGTKVNLVIPLDVNE